MYNRPNDSEYVSRDCPKRIVEHDTGTATPRRDARITRCDADGSPPVARTKVVHLYTRPLHFRPTRLITSLSLC